MIEKSESQKCVYMKVFLITRPRRLTITQILKSLDLLLVDGLYSVEWKW